MLLRNGYNRIAFPLVISRRARSSIVSPVWNRTPRFSAMSSSANGRFMSSSTSPATADLCDKYVESPSRLNICTPGYFKDYGGIQTFSGEIETVKCFESNPMVRSTLGEAGEGRVLVVDGGASQRVAICGDMLAQMACDNNWAGIIVNGCIRDSDVISKIPIGVKAMNTHPLKSAKTHEGERGCTVAFAGVEFLPGMHVYADGDGIIVSETELTLD